MLSCVGLSLIRFLRAASEWSHLDAPASGTNMVSKLLAT